MRQQAIRVLIAPNEFKNALSAKEAARAIAAGLMQSGLACIIECFPVADGGDGTGTLIIEKLAGEVVPAEVSDPLGRRINASFGLLDGGFTAVIEMAAASGIRLLRQHEYAPLETSSRGTGELIMAALDKGARRILLGMGGSATVDGGMGILQALGVRFLDEAGEVLTGGRDRQRVDSIDLSRMDQRILQTDVVVLCDVGNPLLGDSGAARVFGPQKGATMENVVELERYLTKLRNLIHIATGKDMQQAPHGGTAGGAAAGLWACVNAQLVNGADFFLDLTQFDLSLERNDLVITGEGSIDEQTLLGKGPFTVASRAKHKRLPVLGMAGSIPVEASEAFQEYFDQIISIANAPGDLQSAIDQTEANLERTARAVGKLLGMFRSG